MNHAAEPGPRKRIAPSVAADAAQLAALNVCWLVLGHGDSDDVSPWRTAVHESGHSLVQLVEMVDFASLHLYADGSGALSTDGCTATSSSPTRQARIAAQLGGAVAEEIVFDDVEPMGVETDLRCTLARAGIVNPEGLGAEGLEGVRAQVSRVRRMLGRRRRALEGIARALLSVGTLSRRDCARLAQEHGARVRVRPRFSATCPREELRACDFVTEQIKQRRARAGA